MSSKFSKDVLKIDAAEEVERICKRIRYLLARVLKRRGYLLARVNSVKDTLHGYGMGNEVEPNFYEIGGHYKRFFDREMIAEIFRSFYLQKVSETGTTASLGIKHLYEIVGKREDLSEPWTQRKL